MSYTKLREIKKIYFGHEEAAGVLGIKPKSALVACARFVKKGIVIRIKRNVYILKDRWDALGREEKFTLANIIQTPSYISLMTAMDYYEATTQLQQNFIESISIYRTKEVEIEKDAFNYTKINKDLYFDFRKEKGFFIASPEKAFLDALYLSSLQRYSFDTGSIDFNRLNMPKIKQVIKKYPGKTQNLFKKI